ncbi:MAG: flippase-like domain-containing protein [Nitrospirae bacterium]|nr:flippase-like domain-containing protein [Nitrospirota bacterium]
MRLKFWLGTAVSLGLLVFLFSRIDIARLWDTIRSVDPWYLAVATVTSISFFLVRALRWRYLMDPVKPGLSVGSLLSATMIGFMANNVLPARLGEFVRAYALGRKEDVPAGSVFATIVVERLFDGMSILLMMIYVLAAMPEDVAGGDVAATMRKAGMVSLAAYVVMIVVLWYFQGNPETLKNLVRRTVGAFSENLGAKAAHLAGSFVTGLGVVKDVRLLSLIVFWSAVHWGLMWVPVLLLYKAFGLSFGMYAALFYLVATAVSVAVPSTPGFVGTYHAAAMGGLMLLGLDSDTALGVAILGHAMNFVPVTLLGLFYLYRENLSLGGIREVEAKAQT